MAESGRRGWLRMLQASRRVRIGSIVAAPLLSHRYWYVFHTLIVPPAAQRDGLFICRELTHQEPFPTGAFPRARWREEVATWLHDPDVSVFVAFEGRRAVAYESVSCRVPGDRPFRTLRLAHDELWIRDTRALPGYRARGAVRALRAYRDRVVSRLGFCGTVTAVPEDRPALLAATYEKLTWKVAGIEYQQVLTFGKSRIDADAQARLEQWLRMARRRRHAPAPGTKEVPAAA